MKWMMFALLCAISGCSYIKNHPDSPLEELAEEGVEAVTGLDVDLSSDDGD